MAGTKQGGIRAAATNKKRYGKDFYKRIGSKGGSVADIEKGFASFTVGGDGLTGRERARVAGSKGGRISRKGKTAIPVQSPTEGMSYEETRVRGFKILNALRSKDNG